MSEPGGIRVVVVTYCSAATILDCVQRLLASADVTEIVIVDNGSMDDTVARVRALLEAEPRITLRVDPDNPGFAAACDDGAVGCTCAWLAFVNPDCLVEPDTFSRLLAIARPSPQLGALGCVQVDARGVEDAAVRRRDPSLRSILFAGGGRDALNVPGDGSMLQRVDALSGALMLMPGSVFARVGGFDRGYRMHAEDLDLCRRVRAAGFEIAIANEVRVTHLRGVSSRRRPLWVEWQKHRGLWRYFRKFEAAQTSPSMRLLLWCALWAHWLIAAPRAFARSRHSR